MSPRASIRIVAISTALCFMSGCGGGTSKVSGKVTYNGQKVVWGTVTLVDKNGQFHQANIDLDGKYEIENVPVGTVKIAVVSPNPDPGGGGGKGRPKPSGSVGGLEGPREKFMAGKQAAEDARPKPPPGTWFDIPDKFATVEQSELTGEVKGSKTELNIELK